MMLYLLCFLSTLAFSDCFQVVIPRTFSQQQQHAEFQLTNRRSTILNVINGKASARRSTGGGRQQERSKRQDRVESLVIYELSRIIHSGNIKGDATYLDDHVRQRVSIVSANISPDLRQARIAVSIRSGGGMAPSSSVSEEGSDGGIVDKRRAYSWLVTNTKAIRHTLAQRMSHMKTCPTLTFVQVDVAAAVDVMNLIDRISQKGYKRKEVDLFDGMDDDYDDDDDDDDDTPSGVVGGVDFDQNINDDEWIEEDEEFFE